jgi:hypothetical protein
MSDNPDQPQLQNPPLSREIRDSSTILHNIINIADQEVCMICQEEITSNRTRFYYNCSNNVTSHVAHKTCALLAAFSALPRVPRFPGQVADMFPETQEGVVYAPRTHNCPTCRHTQRFPSTVFNGLYCTNGATRTRYRFGLHTNALPQLYGLVNCARNDTVFGFTFREQRTNSAHSRIQNQIQNTPQPTAVQAQQAWENHHEWHETVVNIPPGFYDEIYGVRSDTPAPTPEPRVIIDNPTEIDPEPLPTPAPIPSPVTPPAEVLTAPVTESSSEEERIIYFNPPRVSLVHAIWKVIRRALSYVWLFFLNCVCFILPETWIPDFPDQHHNLTNDLPSVYRSVVLHREDLIHYTETRHSINFNSHQDLIIDIFTHYYVANVKVDLVGKLIEKRAGNQNVGDDLQRMMFAESYRLEPDLPILLRSNSVTFAYQQVMLQRRHEEMTSTSRISSLPRSLW